MATNRQIALAKIRSLQHSLFTAITELEVLAAEAAKRGDDAFSSQLSLQSVALAKESVRLRDAADDIRATMPLTPVVDRLNTIAADARSTVEDMDKIAEAIGKATTLLGIIRRIVTPFV